MTYKLNTTGKEMTNMNIIKEINELVKDVLFFTGYEKIDIANISSMQRDPDAPVIAPLCVPGVSNSPRMTYRRR